MATILVHESNSHWTAELEREFADLPDCQLRWRPYQHELREEAPAATLAVLIVAPGNASLDLIRDLRTHNPELAIVLLTNASELEWEWLAREIGADVILPDITEKERVAHSIRRLLTPKL